MLEGTNGLIQVSGLIR